MTWLISFCFIHYRLYFMFFLNEASKKIFNPGYTLKVTFFTLYLFGICLC